MYELPANATMNDVITRSATCHPSLFQEALLATAAIHASYSHITHDSRAASSAHNMSCDLRRVAADVDMDDLDATEITFSERILAFAVAAKLQCLPETQQAEITSRKVEG